MCEGVRFVLGIIHVQLNCCDRLKIQCSDNSKIRVPPNCLWSKQLVWIGSTLWFLETRALPWCVHDTNGLVHICRVNARSSLIRGRSTSPRWSP
jgi:hypothetical protein